MKITFSKLTISPSAETIFNGNDSNMLVRVTKIKLM
jgi:hypothetical protein